MQPQPSNSLPSFRHAYPWDVRSPSRVHNHRFVRLRQQQLDAFLPDQPAPPRHWRGIQREAVLEEGLTVKILVLRVLQPPRDQGLEELLIDWPRKLCQLVADLSHVSQARTQEIVQLWAVGLELHNAIRNCRVSAPNYQSRRTAIQNLMV